ncbi:MULTISPECIES: hypothetical protein [Acinetobacter]|uniref:Uncharacterized protein n=1 Tax=Acinetobacter higginsii TaxID=70347 RepID=N9RI31_9GAMM|nr:MULTISPECIES: hypothetical protein [Acinetobacter]ENX57658.1 hypothetical protein F902_02055 [Acinetobacter higginsii]
MHRPRPYGLLVVGGKLTADDELFIHHEIKKLTNNKEVSNLNAIRQVKDLPNGGYVILQDMGGILKAITHKPSTLDQLENDGFAKLFIPMLFSGVITKSIVLTETGKVGLKISELTRKRLINYDDEKQPLPLKDLELKRFCIEYNQLFEYFKPKNTGIYTFTQYAKHRPTWYSSAISEVLQIVGGYGRLANIEKSEDPLDSKQFELPLDYFEKIVAKLESVRLPGYTGIPNLDGQFQYDYKFSNTDAISFDTNNKPWLIQINSAGVHAMPLPIVPATATDDFREYIESVSDDEILKILDRFGALPSGEGFPTGLDFHAWKRAGVIIKVCDTSDFYSHNGFYSACGWSLNSKGSEGFNTCYQFLDSMLKLAHGYKLQLDLVKVENIGWLDKIIVKDEYVDVISTYLEKLTNILIKGTVKTNAIMYKLRRVDQQDLYERAKAALNSPSGVDTNEVDYWHNLELKPIANHIGSVSRVTSGNLYHPGKNPKGMGALKFPELTGQGCESFPIIEPEYEGPAMKCDTVVFGSYIEDSLKVIKYFYDERKFTKQEQSTFEDIMIVGSWDKTTTTGLTGLMGKFYTSDFDDRQESPDVTTYTHIEGRDLGYGNPAYQTPPLLFMDGSLSRSRYYTHKIKTKTTSQYSLQNAVCVPAFNRDGWLYAFQDYLGSRNETEKLVKLGIPDPTSYRLWCYDAIFHYLGGGIPYRGEPRSKDGTPVYVDKMIYSPNEYNDYADSGNWFGLPSGGFIDVTGVCGPYTSRSSSTHHAMGVTIGGESPQVEEYETEEITKGETTGLVKLSYPVFGNRTIKRTLPEAWYFDYSPVDAGGLVYFYRDACRVVFGDSEYANISETDANGARIKWGTTSLVDHKSAHHFIGVINE